MKSLFITLEGPEGAGKTTQTAMLKLYFQKRGFKVLQTREPGGPPLSEELRRLVLEPGLKISAEAEALIYAAARAQHVRELILPAINKGVIVLCDRFIDSSLAYQGFGRGLDLDRLWEINLWAAGGTFPDLTFLLDLPVEEGLKRAGARGKRDRFEQEDLDFHRRVRQGFLDLALNDPGRIKVINAVKDPDIVHQQIVEFLPSVAGQD